MNPLPGFRDFYPETLAVRRYIFGQWRDAARRYGFREYDGPPLEPLELYTQKSGEEIVAQLYNFMDKGDRAVSLRPEMTPTLARMVGAHHRDYKKPIKWFAVPQLFRYERQQRGRLREHFQFNADIIGESDISADAELIALAIDTLRSFGLTEKDFVVRISSRGEWEQCFSGVGLDRQQYDATFQAIDKLEREPIETTRQKLAALSLPPAAVEEVLAFADQKTMSQQAQVQPVFGILRVSGLDKFCELDYRIVRGLAYYTGIVWEIHDREGELRAIAGGGRYDNLVNRICQIDAKEVRPAVGFGMGDVVLAELLKDRGLLPELKPELDCYVIAIGGEATRGYIRMSGGSGTFLNLLLEAIHTWRDAGMSVDYAFSGSNVTKQLQVANEKGARYVVLFGPREFQGAGMVTLKNMTTGHQEQIRLQDVAAKIAARVG
jgi:histidyl-tRNA synthetase